MKKIKVPSLVTVLILTLITIIFWIIFGVFRILSSKPAVNIPKEVLEPFSPTLDSNSFDKMERGIFFEK